MKLFIYKLEMFKFDTYSLMIVPIVNCDFKLIFLQNVTFISILTIPANPTNTTSFDVFFLFDLFLAWLYRFSSVLNGNQPVREHLRLDTLSSLDHKSEPEKIQNKA